MGILTIMKAQKAYNLQAKGNTAEAEALYQQCMKEGLNQPRYLLGYSVLLLRSGKYQEAREVLVKTQKAPGLTQDQRSQMLMNYAAAIYRLGDIDKGINLLERQHLHSPSGRMYQTLGYLYVVKYDAANRPDFDALDAAAQAEREAAAAAKAAEAADEGEGDENEFPAEAEDVPGAPDEPEAEAEKAVSAREVWEAGIAKAKAFIEESVDYDEEDSICLDNMAQFYYRVLGDRETAKEWFEKAIAEKDDQMDTLWFLSRYDLEQGDTAKALERLEKIRGNRFSPLNYVTPEMVDEEIKRLEA